MKKDFNGKVTKVKNGSWTVFSELCKSCGLCLQKCPNKALIFGKEKGFTGGSLPQVDPEKCNLCRTCEINCPDCAIKVEKDTKEKPTK